MRICTGRSLDDGRLCLDRPEDPARCWAQSTTEYVSCTNPPLGTIYLEERRIQREQSLLLRLGSKRLGAPDVSTIETLKAIKDVERLERVGEALLSASSWQELLATQ